MDGVISQMSTWYFLAVVGLVSDVVAFDQNSSDPCDPKIGCILDKMYTTKVDSGGLNLHTYKTRKSYLNRGRLHLYVESIQPHHNFPPIAISIISNNYTDYFQLPFKFPTIKDEPSYTYNFVNRTLYPLGTTVGYNDTRRNVKTRKKAEIRIVVSSDHRPQSQFYRFVLSRGSPYFVSPGNPLTLDDLSPSHPAMVRFILPNDQPWDDDSFFLAHMETNDEICSSVNFQQGLRPAFVVDIIPANNRRTFASFFQDSLKDLFNNNTLPSDFSHQSADRKAAKVFGVDSLRIQGQGELAITATLVVKPDDSTCRFDFDNLHDNNRKKTVTFSLDLLPMSEFKYYAWIGGMTSVWIVSILAFLLYTRSYYAKLYSSSPFSSNLLSDDVDDDESDVQVHSVDVTQDEVAVKHGSEGWLLVVFAIVATLPVVRIDLISAYRDRDLCYFNEECFIPSKSGTPRPSGSNAVYLVLGLACCATRLMTVQKVHKLYYYLMGVSLILHSCCGFIFNFCPNEQNLILVTMFVVVTIVLVLNNFYRLLDLFGVKKFTFFPQIFTFQAATVIIWMSFPSFATSKILHSIAFVLFSPILAFCLYYEGLEGGRDASLKNLPVMMWIRMKMFRAELKIHLKSLPFLCGVAWIGLTLVWAIVGCVNWTGFAVSLPFFATVNFLLILIPFLCYFWLRIKFCAVADEELPLNFKIKVAFLAFLICFFSLSALICYNLRASDYSLTPAQSRRLNTPCIGQTIYDNNDIFHFFSALAVFAFFCLHLLLEDFVFLHGQRSNSERDDRFAVTAPSAPTPNLTYPLLHD